MTDKLMGRIAGRPVAVREGSELVVGGTPLSSTGARVADVKTLKVGSEEAITWAETGGKDGFERTRRYFAVRTSDGELSAPRPAASHVHLRSGSFDPSVALLDGESPTLAGPQLAVLQLETQMLEGYRAALEAQGVELGPYVPDHAFLAHVPDGKLADVQKLSFVRAASILKVEDKCSAAVRGLIDADDSEVPVPATYDILSLRPEDKRAVADRIRALGGTVNTPDSDGGLLLSASLTSSQLRDVTKHPRVTWVDPASPAEFDVDNARLQGGAVHLEEVAGLTGKGLRGHVLEGIEKGHPEFAGTEHREPPIPVGDGRSTTHGTATYGIVYGAGNPTPQARGMLPDAQGYFTHSDEVTSGRRSRYELTKELMEKHGVMFQTASWGGALTQDYTAVSAELDHVIFQLDLPVTQSQSNNGNRLSRPQAWGKNVISVGAMNHFDNTDMGDDAWKESASIGPATDGRIKPDIAAYYDKTFTTTVLGGYRPDFGGTSGATPTVNGYVGLIYQMWTDGIFGNPLPHGPGADAESRFANRPHFSTVKALLIASAKQWTFSGADADRTRVHQGWGFPDAKYLYEMRDKVFAVNESEVLKTLEFKRYELDVGPGEPLLKVTMVFPDPPGAVGAARQRVNDLDLKVTAPDGTVYHGNHGLLESMFSKAGGAPNQVDTVENVFIENPAAGKWTVEVLAAEVNQDGHLETPEADVDFALVAIGAKRP